MQAGRYQHNGKEVIFYHGTDGIITSFEPLNYFTSSEKVVKRYGSSIHKAYLHLKNPLILTGTLGSTDYYLFIDVTEAKMDEYKRFGYDSIIYEGKLEDKDSANLISAIVFDGAQVEEIKESGGLLAPNGKPTNLTSEQYRLVRTPEFKAWFGDWENSPETASKVIDENGEPLVVYHGRQSTFNEFGKDKIGNNFYSRFGKGFYLTEIKSNAEHYGLVISIFLSIKNPLIVNYFSQYITPIEAQKNKGNRFERDKILSKDNNEILSSLGYDGVIFMYLDKMNEIVAFYPEQIKLADGTNTTFERNNPDIRFEIGGPITTEYYLGEIKEAVDEVLRNDPQFANPEDCKDCCVMASQLLMEELAKRGIPSKLIGDFMHAWVRVGDCNIDLTARQFNPNENCPKIWRTKADDKQPYELSGNSVSVCNKLYKDHHESWDQLDAIEKNLNESNAREYAYELCRLCDTEFLPHFAEEERELFPKIANAQNQQAIDELILQHKILLDLIDIVEHNKRAADIRKFCSEIKAHIKKEEALMKTIAPDPFKKKKKKLPGTINISKHEMKKGGYVDNGEYKTLLSLFDYSGAWSKPFRDAGWNVIQWDIKLSEFMDINMLEDAETVLDMFENVDGIIAAPPCTDFASSGAHVWKFKDEDGRTHKSVEMVKQVMRLVNLFAPTDPEYEGVWFWAIENPVGRMGKLVEINRNPWYFDPYEFAGWLNPSKKDLAHLDKLRAKQGIGLTREDAHFVQDMNAYTKKTGLWGDFAIPEKKPIEPVYAKQGSTRTSPMAALTGGKGAKTKELRSNTPLGFAKAFYEANKNYQAQFQPGYWVEQGWTEKEEKKILADHNRAEPGVQKKLFGKGGLLSYDELPEEAKKDIDRFLNSDDSTDYFNNNEVGPEDLRWKLTEVPINEAMQYIGSYDQSPNFMNRADALACKIKQSKIFNPPIVTAGHLEGNHRIMAAWILRKTMFSNGTVPMYLMEPIEEFSKGGKISQSQIKYDKVILSPEFKAWFGNWEPAYKIQQEDPGIDVVSVANLRQGVSKILDWTGKPLVVYHGNIQGTNEFTEFKPQSFGSYGENSMFYFATDKNWVKQYAKRFGATEEYKKPRRFFLDIKNPLDLTNLNFTPSEWIDFLKSKNLLTEYIETGLKNTPTSVWYRTKLFSWQIFRYDMGAFRKKLIENGYDGIKLTDSNYGSKGSNVSYVALYPNQIKLADGTNTTFDGSNPDIRFEDGGEIDKKLNDFTKTDVQFISLQNKSDNAFRQRQKLEKERFHLFKKGENTNEIDERIGALQKQQNEFADKSIQLLKNKVIMLKSEENELTPAAWLKKNAKKITEAWAVYYKGDLDRARKEFQQFRDAFVKTEKSGGTLYKLIPQNEKIDFSQLGNGETWCLNRESALSGIELSAGQVYTIVEIYTKPKNLSYRYSAVPGNCKVTVISKNKTRVQGIWRVSADGIIPVVSNTNEKSIEEIMQLNDLVSRRAALIKYVVENRDVKIVIAFSGGKDSIAMLLHLLELGVQKSQIELWHHDVDGHGEELFDWKVTPEYCKAFADAMGVTLLFSYRDGGIVKRLLRNNEPLGNIWYQTPDYQWHMIESNQESLNTGGRWPAIGANLESRWCSGEVKISVAERVFNNDPRFTGTKEKPVEVVFCTGERHSESTKRSTYAEIEKYRKANQEDKFHSERKILTWRPIIEYSEEMVWELLKKWKIQPHPCYYLGWGRCSCQLCIFNEAPYWATSLQINPEKIIRIRQLEIITARYPKNDGKEHTLYDGMDIYAKCNSGTPVIDVENEESKFWIKQATEQFTLPIFVPSEWKLPSGAFKKENCGAS